MSCHQHFPGSSLAARESEGGSEAKGRRERPRARFFRKAASSQQQQPTPVGRHRKGVGGGERVCGSVRVCVCVGKGVRGAVKALIYVCTLRYSSIPVCCC